MLKTTSFAALAVLVSTLAFVARSNTSATRMTQATTVAMEEQSEVVHVEKLFSGAHWTRPAPVTWSSRLEIRWNARWENAPQYAV